MANYYYDRGERKSYNRRQRFRRGAKFLAVLLLLIFLLGGAYIWRSNASDANGPVVIKKPTNSYYAGAPKRLYQTEQFKFESTGNWQMSQEESLAPTKYVYFTHSLNNNLINFELDIIFNKPIGAQAVNYVMPVNVINGSQIKTDILSSRCGDNIINKNAANAPNTLAMEFHGARYICAVRGSTEKAAAALIGGSYDIALKRPNGQSVVLNFVFDNNSSSYFGQAFKEVLDSFSLK